ncbi:MAG: hypothetical protein AAF192_18110 [Pseudomonadota bacterium]
MGFFRGLDGVVKAGASATVVGEVQSWGFTEEATIEAAWSMGQTSQRHFVAAPPAGSGQMEVYLDPSDAGQGQMIVPGATVALELYPGGETSGSGYFTFAAIIETVDRSGSKSDIATMSISFKIDGAVTSTTVS